MRSRMLQIHYRHAHCLAVKQQCMWWHQLFEDGDAEGSILVDANNPLNCVNRQTYQRQ